MRENMLEDGLLFVRAGSSSHASWTLSLSIQYPIDLDHSRHDGACVGRVLRLRGREHDSFPSCNPSRKSPSTR